mgnify:CR=1 FL=1
MTHDNTNTQTFRKTSTYAMVVTALMDRCHLHSRTIICSNWSGANFTY